MYTVIELPELTSRAQAEDIARSACFRLAPPTLVGAELEFLTECGAQSGARPSPAILAAALGDYTPASINPASPALALPGGGKVCFEAGCQAEVASQPFASATELVAALRQDVSVLQLLLDAAGVRVVAAAADDFRAPALGAPTPRKRAGWAYWARMGTMGAHMTANTAATQVSVDAGADPGAVSARWTMLNTVGPAFVAAFACSSALYGVRGAWVSQRMRAWLHSDDRRTFPPVQQWEDPIQEYPRWVLDVPLLCVRRETGDWTAPADATFADWVCGGLDDVIGRRPTETDLRLHLNTAYPPVRPQGHLEVRYIDGQPDGLWSVPIYAVAALSSSPAAVAEATALAESSAGRWADAARDGLADIELRFTATSLLRLAAEHAETPAAALELHRAADRCHGGLGPTAGEPLAA